MNKIKITKIISFLTLISLLSILIVGCNQKEINKENVVMAEEEVIFEIGSKQMNCTGVGPQKCFLVNGEYFYDSIEGFEFESGYEYQIKVIKKERSEPIPADASKYTYTLVEVISKKLDIPENCESWFDGCNNCFIQDGELGGCTRKYCSPEIIEEPKCLKFKDEV